MNTLRCFGIAAVVCFLSFEAAAKQDVQPGPGKFDVSVLFGGTGSSSFGSVDDESYRVDTDYATNFAVSINSLMRHQNGSRLQYEFYMSQSEMDLAVEDADSGDEISSSAMDVRYFHFGGVNEVERVNDEFVPYLGISVGATSFSSDVYDSELEFSVGLNTGIKWLATDSFGARLDIRAFGTVIDTDAEFFCSDGDCIAKNDGGLWWQYQASAGVFFRF